MEQNEGKTLASILKPTYKGYPVVGQDGYGGEQDGSAVEFMGVLSFPSREVAKKIQIGKRVGIHWAEYHHGTGWQVSLAHWDDAPEEDVWVMIDPEIKARTEWMG